MKALNIFKLNPVWSVKYNRIHRFPAEFKKKHKNTISSITVDKYNIVSEFSFILLYPKVNALFFLLRWYLIIKCQILYDKNCLKRVKCKQILYPHTVCIRIILILAVNFIRYLPNSIICKLYGNAESGLVLNATNFYAENLPAFLFQYYYAYIKCSVGIRCVVLTAINVQSNTNFGASFYEKNFFF